MNVPQGERVALVISSLDAGGAERVISTMANHWAERGRDVSVITIESADRDFYALDPRVRRTGLGASGRSASIRQAVANNVRRIRRLRAAIRDVHPDAVISFLTSTNILALIAGGLARIPVIVSERIDPTQEPAPRFWSALRRFVYPRALAVVVQTPEVQAWAEEFLPSERVRAIPNFVRVPPEASKDEQAADMPRERRRVVAIGRLHRQKGFDTLIRAFARCHAAEPEWSLTIVGEGDERSRLEALAADLGIAASVEMPGRVQNPFSVLRRADLFVLASRYEGFPNVLLEAMAVGTAVIATDCRSGPARIVRHGVDGLLVPPDDVDAMADAIASLMRDDDQRRALGARAVEVTERFSEDRVMSEWERLVAQATRGRRDRNNNRAQRGASSGTRSRADGSKRGSMSGVGPFAVDTAVELLDRTAQ
ncbi:MAG TPA: glycosyltransferase family 4 protein [Gemmatimonadaceae bacterium]|nr:glycosyltransferase family 4 protein [Gemmatimonadaceae bacterium]